MHDVVEGARRRIARGNGRHDVRAIGGDPAIGSTWPACNGVSRSDQQGLPKIAMVFDEDVDIWDDGDLAAGVEQPAPSNFDPRHRP